MNDRRHPEPLTLEELTRALDELTRAVEGLDHEMYALERRVDRRFDQERQVVDGVYKKLAAQLEAFDAIQLRIFTALEAIEARFSGRKPS